MVSLKSEQARPRGGQPAGLQAARRHKVGILWLKGFTVRDIANLIQKDTDLVGADKTTYVTVHKDITAIKGDLKKHSIGELEIRRARSVSHLKMIQARAWTEIGRIMQSPGSRSSLLSVISAAEDRIAKLEGTYAPTEITGKDGKPLVPATPMIFNLPEGGVFPPPGGNGEGDRDNGDRESDKIPGG